MKLKYFQFLIYYIISISVFTLFKLLLLFKSDIYFIFSNLLFIFGFLITFFFAIGVTVKNKDVVIKIGNKLPLVIPFVIFSIITLPQIIIFESKNIFNFLSSIVIYIFSFIVYIITAFYLVKNLKKELQNEKEILLNKYNKTDNFKKKLLLINPINENNKIKNSSEAVPPLGLGIIAALTPDDFYIKLIDENFTDFKYEDADLVAVTGLTSAVTRAYKIAGEYKKRKIPVIMGGVHATVMPDEAKNYVDTVVTGEAERVWGEVIKDFLKGKLKRRYNGTPNDANEFVVPRRDLFDDKYLFATIQTSRGCPLNCSFCSVSVINGKKYRQRSVNEVLDELENILQHFVFFVDDNILGYGKNSERRTIDLFKGMVERKIKKEWFCQSSINFGANDEVLYWAKKAGCRVVFLGLESTDAEELKGMNKNINVSADFNAVFKKINNHGIAVLGAFIYGGDYETSESMRRKTEYIIKEHIDIIQATVYTPLPGTALYKEFYKNKRLIYKNYPNDWDKYDLTQLTFSVKNMSNNEFEMRMSQSASKLLARSTLIKKFFKTLFHTKNLTSAIWSLNTNLFHVITRQLIKK